MNDPIIWRGIERLLIVLCCGFFGYLGYKLFLYGVNTGKGKVDFKSNFANIVFSGTGPGLFFMAFGSIVLLIALFTGKGVKTTTAKGDKLNKEDIEQMKLFEISREMLMKMGPEKRAELLKKMEKQKKQ
jgi:hypothetical protein